MPASALQAEVAAYIAAHADQDGHRLGGPQRPSCSAGGDHRVGAVPVRAPRVNDKRVDATGERERFASTILPTWSRKSPRLPRCCSSCTCTAVPPDFGPALEQFVGSDAWPIRRDHQPAHHAAADRGQPAPAGRDRLRLHVGRREPPQGLEQDKRYLLVMIGVRADGGKELLALAAGFRESAESWADMLGSPKVPGMRAPVLAVGDGALGFWAAVREVFPRPGAALLVPSPGQRATACRVRSTGARAELAEIYNAEDCQHALKAVKAFEADYGTKWPKAVAEITGDLDVLLEF